MSETLTGRVGRLISASITALFDEKDDSSPDAVMAKAIAEVDAVIDEVRLELGRVVASRHLANKRLMNEQRKHEALAVEIDLLIGQGRDDLAEAAIARQIDIETQIPLLNVAITNASNQLEDLEAYVAALQAKKREMSVELQTFQFVQKQEVQIQGSGAVLADNANVATGLDRATSDVDTARESATDMASSGDLDRDNQALTIKLAELEELMRKKKIKARLSSIKGKS